MFETTKQMSNSLFICEHETCLEHPLAQHGVENHGCLAQKKKHLRPSSLGVVLATSRDGNDAGVTESVAPTQGDLVCAPA